MSNNPVAPITMNGQISTKFAGMDASINNEASAGIEMGFPILGFKGKVWTERYRGEDKTLMRDDGDGPRNSVEVVVIKVSAAKSKIFYKDGYKEGSTEAPDCFSTNGVTPDPQSKAKQHDVCATCPMNQWGSRTTTAGKKGKACSDAKRAAIAPLHDIKNEARGGPLLLRVPAASLQGLAGYVDQLKSMGFPYCAVGTRISFDAAEAYPKFVFGAIRPLTDAEADAVIELRDSRQVERILAEDMPVAPPQQQQITAPTPQTFFEQPPPTASAPQPAHGFVQATIPASAVQPQPAPVTREVTSPPTAAEEDFDSKLDGLLGK
jgi:hypothetical protein